MRKSLKDLKARAAQRGNQFDVQPDWIDVSFIPTIAVQAGGEESDALECADGFQQGGQLLVIKDDRWFMGCFDTNLNLSATASPATDADAADFRQRAERYFS
jgi:hypothetical protein